MKHLLCLALVISPLCPHAYSAETTPATAKPGTALERLKALSLAVGQSKDEITKAKTEEDVISALQTMEKRFADLTPIKSEQPEPEPDQAEFMKSLPDIRGLQKAFATAMEQFENIALVSCQFNHSLRLHVYGRVMRSLKPEQVKDAMQQELEMLEPSAKMLKSTVSVFEKSASREPDSEGSKQAQEHAKANLGPAKHRLELTQSSIDYLNKALANPWFKKAQDEEK
jgi:hypothetical protein